MAIVIERKSAPIGKGGYPFQDARGFYHLVDRRVPEDNRVSKVRYVDDLKKAADLVEFEGYSVRMLPSKRSGGSLIKSLRVTRT